MRRLSVDYYRINKGKLKYKRGTALLQIAHRPYCQYRDWVVLANGGAAPAIECLVRRGDVREVSVTGAELSSSGPPGRRSTANDAKGRVARSVDRPPP